MKKFIEKSYKEKRVRVESKINNINIRIKALLEEPRTVVSHILNNLYDEKEQLNSKLNEIDNILKSLENIDSDVSFKEIKVKVNGKSKKLYLVQDMYVDPKNGFISHNSPIGVAVKDKKAGEKFKIDTPLGFKQYQIL